MLKLPYLPGNYVWLWVHHSQSTQVLAWQFPMLTLVEPILTAMSTTVWSQLKAVLLPLLTAHMRALSEPVSVAPLLKTSALLSKILVLIVMQHILPTPTVSQLQTLSLLQLPLLLEANRVEIPLGVDIIMPL